MKLFKRVFIIVFSVLTVFSVSLSCAESINIRELKKLLELGKRYCEIKRFKKAIRKYQEAFERFNSPDAAYNLGVTYEIDIGDREKALYYYGKFLELEKNSIDAYNVKRWISEIKFDFKREAKSKKLEYERQAANIKSKTLLQEHEGDKNSPSMKRLRTLKKLANQEVIGKNYQKGVEIYLKVLDITEDSDVAYNLGFVYDHYLKNYEEAGYYYRKFLNLEPYSSDASQVKKWLKRVEEKL